MNSPLEEYQSALLMLESVLSGQLLVKEVAGISQVLAQSLSDALEGKKEIPTSLQPFLANDMAKMAIALLGRERLSEVIEKNCILFIGRIATVARRIDSVALEEKLSFVLKVFASISVGASKWNFFLEESTRQSHDKKERRARRHLLQEEGKHQITEVEQKKGEECVRRLLPYVLPNGISSLYLPAGGEVFLPKLSELLEESLPAIAVWLEERLFSRGLKTDLLYRAYSGFYSWFQKEVPQAQIPPPNVSSAVLQGLSLAIPSFCHAFIPSLFTEGVELREDIIAENIIEVVFPPIQALCLESLFMEGVLLSVKSATTPIALHSEEELVQLIGTMACDERIVRGILKRIIPSPELPISGKEGKIGIIFDLLVYGLKASAAELLTKGALASFNWEEAQRVAFERFRWFSYSPYFDQALLEGLM